MVRRRSFGLEEIESKCACSATPDVPKPPLAANTVEDEHERIVHGVCNVGWSWRSGCCWVGVKRANDLLLQNLGGGDDAPHVGL